MILNIEVSGSSHRKESTNCRFKGTDFPVALHDDKFPKKEPVTTQEFTISMFKKQTPKSSL